VLTHRYERGQTMPFWIMALLVSLTLAFFVSNYANTVKYQIHAQNAADSAAAAALGNDAAALNSEQTLLAAFDIQEARVQNITAALPFVLGTSPCGATNLLTQTCTKALEGAATDLTAANKSLANVATTLNNFQGQFLNGTLTDTLANPNTTVNAFFAPNGSGGCSINILTDCDFKYSTYPTYNSNGIITIDEYACKKVTNVAASFLHLPLANSTFYAIGHTTATLAPVSALYNPSTLGTALTSASTLFPSIAGSQVIGDLSGLNINSAFFETVGAPPPTTTRSVTQVCPS
jgi:hypothetical protein